MNDLISRISLKQSIVTSMILADGKTLEQIIDEEPSIDAVKHGRWIMTTKADYAWECSACGHGFCDNRTIYCYDCGARMDGEENEQGHK